MKKFISLFLIFLNLLFVLISDSLINIAEITLVILSILIVIDYYNKKSISFYQTWLLSFIFIILSEAILTPDNKQILKATQFLIIANSFVIFGYFFDVKYNFRASKNYADKIRINKIFPFFIYALVVFYVLYSLPNALASYKLGRDAASQLFSKETNLILDSIFDALALILPSIIVFYHKEIKKRKSLITPFILSLPVFTVLFISGTRFPLLFSFGGFLLVSQVKGNGRIALNTKLIGLLALLIISATIMARFRSDGLRNFKFMNSSVNNELRLSQKIASYMSPEGVIDMTALSMEYFKTNPHTYGKSIAFLTYFWIPRQLWPEKPTMLGHWLIREFRSGFGSGHSASFGFVGELYADFGYFSLFFIFLLGILLQKADIYRKEVLESSQGYSKIIIGMMFSYVFFFVRSPITASINFIGIIIVFSIVRRIIFKKKFAH